jgi:hypothetical protein
VFSLSPTIATLDLSTPSRLKKALTISMFGLPIYFGGSPVEPVGKKGKNYKGTLAIFSKKTIF